MAKPQYISCHECRSLKLSFEQRQSITAVADTIHYKCDSCGKRDIHCITALAPAYVGKYLSTYRENGPFEFTPIQHKG